MSDKKISEKHSRAQTKQDRGSTSVINMTPTPTPARSTPISESASTIAASPKTPVQPAKPKRKRLTPEPDEDKALPASNLRKRCKVIATTEPPKSPIQQLPKQFVQQPIQPVTVISSAPPKPPKIQTKFFAIDLNETKKRYSPRSDLARTRDGSTMRPRLTPRAHENEAWRAYRLRKEAEKDDDSPFSGRSLSPSSAVKKPSDTRLGKLIAKAIKDAGTTGDPAMRSPLRSMPAASPVRMGSMPIRKQRVSMASPQKPKGIFPQAEKRFKAAQGRIAALDNDGLADKP